VVVVDEGAQVECGGAGAQPGVVLGEAEVAQLDAPSVLGGGPGDDPLDGRAGGVGLCELRGAGLGAGGAQQVLVRVVGSSTGHGPFCILNPDPLSGGASWPTVCGGCGP
jgi:hypothetical protein